MGSTRTAHARLSFANDTALTETFEYLDCWNCGLVFAMPQSYVARRRDDGRGFQCPNGHANYFTDTKEKQLERQLKSAREDSTWLKRERDAARDLARSERQRAAAYKGHLTRMKNRVARGVCPKSGCKRSFTQLHDHIRTEHPELVDELDLS